MAPRNPLAPPHRRSWFRLAALLVLALGCGHIESADRRGNDPPPVDDASFNVGCRELIKELEQAAVARDIDAFNRCIDWRETVRLAATPRRGSEDFNEWYATTTFEDLTGKFGLAAEVIEMVSGGGEFRCLRTHAIDGEQRALFRLLVPVKASLDYLEFVLARRSDGSVCAVDCYSIRTGELTSERERRRYQSIAPVLSRLLAGEEPSEDDRRFIEDTRIYAEMEAHAYAGNNREALACYEKMSPVFQQQKTVLFQRLEAANSLGGEEYAKAMQAVQSALPSDPSLDFILLDYFFAHRQFDEMRLAIDRIDRRIGGDPQQDVRRAISYMAENNHERARMFAQKAISAEPSLFLPYCLLLRVAASEQEFAEAIRLLTAIDEQFGTDALELTADPLYDEFLKSPQYQEWLKARKPR
jgi:tetratricopeptide (TPR) repeat protein